MKKLCNCLVFTCLTFTATTYAQVAVDSELFLQLKTLDSLIFDGAFNNCELEHLENLVAEDMEFFHDQGGITNSKEAFIQTIKENICGNPDVKPIRKLVDESLEVFPMYNQGKLYGAIQNGVHEFYLKMKGEDALKMTSTAKFTHLWLLDGEQWRLARVLSFDHQAP